MGRIGGCAAYSAGAVVIPEDELEERQAGVDTFNDNSAARNGDGSQAPKSVSLDLQRESAADGSHTHTTPPTSFRTGKVCRTPLHTASNHCNLTLKGQKRNSRLCTSKSVCVKLTYDQEALNAGHKRPRSLTLGDSYKDAG